MWYEIQLETTFYVLHFLSDISDMCTVTTVVHSTNKKLSYRRETARQLHMTTWAGQLTFGRSHVAVECTEHGRIAEVVLFLTFKRSDSRNAGRKRILT